MDTLTLVMFDEKKSKCSLPLPETFCGLLDQSMP